MKIVFKIFIVEENWVNVDTNPELLTVFKDWGSEFKSEEAAFLTLSMEDRDIKNPAEFIIQKVITI